MAKVKVCIRTKWSKGVFFNMKRLGVYSPRPPAPQLTSWNEIVVHRGVAPSVNLAGTRLYTWVEGGTV